jgi:hypothetical protein
MLPSRTAGQVLPASPSSYFSWLEHTHTLESLGAARPGGRPEVQIDGGVEPLSAWLVTADLFDGVLGVRPALGRFFGSEYGRPGGPTGVILSYDLWIRRFGGSPGVIGRLLGIGDDAREIMGVLPQGVGYPISLGPAADLYLPYVASEAERTNNTAYSMFVVGRMRPGVTVEQARADISSGIVRSLSDQVAGPAKQWMLLVLAAVIIVLLVASVNVDRHPQPPCRAQRGLFPPLTDY